MSKFKNIWTPTFRKKIRDLLALSVGGGIAFLGVGVYTNNAEIYKSFIMPVFHKMDPETAHRLTILAAKYKLVPNVQMIESELLESTVLGLKFTNPVGVAAGYDKNGEAVEGLFRMGFGFVEVGSVTPKPQPGNPTPRVFRLPSIGGIINRYGFNSDGHDAVFDRLSKIDSPNSRKGVLGVNLGKNKESENPVQDYVLGVRKFGSLADYLVINVSSPNTPGLRNLQQKKELEALTSAVMKERDSLPCPIKPPIFLKISPDLSLEDKKDIVSVISKKQFRVDGLIVSNTTISRPFGVDCEHLHEKGGLSGKPLTELANETLRDMAKLTKGKIPIIGVGGVSSGTDAKEKIYNGANLVQLYTAFAFEGPPIVRRVAGELEEELRKDGFKTIEEAVGSKLR